MSQGWVLACICACTLQRWWRTEVFQGALECARGSRAALPAFLSSPAFHTRVGPCLALEDTLAVLRQKQEQHQQLEQEERATSSSPQRRQLMGRMAEVAKQVHGWVAVVCVACLFVPRPAQMVG